MLTIVHYTFFPLERKIEFPWMPLILSITSFSFFPLYWNSLLGTQFLGLGGCQWSLHYWIVCKKVLAITFYPGSFFSFTHLHEHKSTRRNGKLPFFLKFYEVMDDNWGESQKIYIMINCLSKSLSSFDMLIRQVSSS